MNQKELLIRLIEDLHKLGDGVVDTLKKIQPLLKTVGEDKEEIPEILEKHRENLVKLITFIGFTTSGTPVSEYKNSVTAKI